MAMACSARALLFMSFTGTWLFAQQIPQHSVKTMGPERVPLGEVSTVPIPSLPPESIVMPVFCEPGGGILFRLATPNRGVEDPVSVSGDGKTVIHFGSWKINDITDPVMLSVFLSGSDVYILTKGSVPLGRESKWSTPKGDVISRPAAKASTFIAHFESDGRYAGAVPLDLPFRALHLGVFESGEFLIAGAESGTDEPRVAIVGSDGQLLRFVQLKGDVHGRADSEVAEKEKDPTAFPRVDPSGLGRSLRDVVSTSQIAPDGTNLLLFREMSGPVFSISPSGAAEVHNLRVGGHSELFTIRAARPFWIAEILHDLPQGGGEEFSVYAFDPESDKPMREYFFPKDFGWGLACTDGSKFSFIVADNDRNTVSLVKLSPTVKLD